MSNRYGERGRGRNRGSHRYNSRGGSRGFSNNRGYTDNNDLLRRIMGRLDALENRSRDNRSHSNRRNTNRGQNRPVSNTRLDGRRSDNPDFQRLVRETFRYAQIAHHQHNWANCPNSIANNIDKIVSNIKPPQPTQQLNNSLQAAADDFKSAITARVQSHLQKLHETTRGAIADLDRRDQDLANEVVGRQLQRRLGRRLHQPTISMALDQLRSTNNGQINQWISVTRRNTDSNTAATAPSAQPPPTGPQRISTSNRFQMLVNEEIEQGAATVETTDHDYNMENNPTTHKRRRRQIGQVDKRLRTPTEDGDIFDALLGPPLPIVRVHNPEKRSSWKIEKPPNGMDTLVITDSNGMIWADATLPEGWTVDAFRGARLHDAADLLCKSTTDIVNINQVIIAVGINDRCSSTPDSIVTDLNRIKSWAAHHDKWIIFSAIPIFPSLTTTVQQTISNINMAASDIFGNDYVPSVARDDIEIFTDDHSGIHYNKKTAMLVINNILSVLN